MYTLFPMLHRDYTIHGEEELASAKIAAIKSSALFNCLPAERMAHYYANSPDSRMWKAITVLVPRDKVVVAERLGQILYEEKEYAENYS